MNSHGTTVCNENNAISGAFSALHLLKSYSFLNPTPDLCRYDHHPIRDYNLSETEVLANRTTIESSISPLAAFSLHNSLIPPSPFLAAMPPLMQPINIPQTLTNSASIGTTRHLVCTSGMTNIHRRPRSEKKPIPDAQKDEKYYERRKRNNRAAKKSRDARKIREDHIALRATMLEHENAILRAQVLTLREEAQSLRHMLIKQQTSGMQHIPRSLTPVIGSMRLSPTSNPIT